MPVRDTALPDDNVYEIIDGFSKQPLNGATIIGGDMQAISDEQGKFKFNMLRDKITISHVGYETREFLLSDALMPKRIELAPKSDVLPEVSIMASGHTQCTRRLGAVSIVRVITPFQNFVRKMEQWIPDSAVKVFPNPINKGQMLNVQFSLPAPGKYALSIFAVDGRLLHVQPILITDAKQMFRLPTSWAYAAGIYWLHIRNTLGKEKVYEIKLVLK
jgi:hypothetical protein